LSQPAALPVVETAAPAPQPVKIDRQDLGKRLTLICQHYGSADKAFEIIGKFGGAQMLKDVPETDYPALLALIIAEEQAMS
jgi:hypothetical protein